MFEVTINSKLNIPEGEKFALECHPLDTDKLIFDDFDEAEIFINKNILEVITEKIVNIGLCESDTDYETYLYVKKIYSNFDEYFTCEEEPNGNHGELTVTYEIREVA